MKPDVKGMIQVARTTDRIVRAKTSSVGRLALG
jgi:hypothetical protein